ncbi:NADPH-dependent F420 reductase [Emticicia sp. C21]|uniref:NADPH-dependent F420 reductase n=1 Tax=Emticicia sp. C21 TaxID=2302915 RepID=UPI000E34E967|nr:NAD(P)-binding domain-containing protein [Emticicia sp. C21]RFS17029.1 NADP oxidoreductase coenzyme F420-dependent [Emticicia sp. C21]
MQAINNQKIAVIGLGNIGQVVATNLAKNNRTVIVADRNIEKANRMAVHLGSIATPLSIEEAIKAADIIVLSVWFSAIKEVFEQYDSLLQGKIIIDPSNPIAPNDKGGFDKIIGETESAGQINATLLPKGAKLAKALGTLGATNLANAANQQPENVLFYATDDTTINEAVESLIQANGFAPVRVGGIDQSIRIEVFGDLHEYGALGKTVTLAEVKI